MGSKLNIGVLGTRGIGQFHIREFASSGANVVAVLGKSEENSRDFFKEFGVKVNYYNDLEEMLNSEQLDAVSICTPPETHKYFAEKCLNKGLHVLCEKPLLVAPQNQIYFESKRLIDLAKSKNKILTVNTQWPSVLNEIYSETSLHDFEIYMEPGEIGENMLIDHLPHSNSILVKLIPGGKIENLRFITKKDKEIRLKFCYVNKQNKCNVKYHFKYNPSKPRKIEISFNGKKFKRVVGERYEQQFETESGRINIKDPLKRSIEMFLEAIKDKKDPLINYREILESAILQDNIFSIFPRS